jgi:hypothetical protein
MGIARAGLAEDSDRRMNVFFTIDVEVWCGGWSDLDRNFPGHFAKYVYGRTPRGAFGLPFILQRLREAGLSATCFTEPLFAARFGIGPLREIVGLIVEHGHDVQLHMHTEWVDESITPLLPTPSSRKRQFMRHFSAEEQATLIAKGSELLQEAGAPRPRTFRAGSFGFNRDTLAALLSNGIQVDASYNECALGPTSGMPVRSPLRQPTLVDGVFEYPMSVFRDGTGRLRHAQVGACSFEEMRDALVAAADQGWSDFVILFHNFELLKRDQTLADRIAIRRFERLCDFLGVRSDLFNTQVFGNIDPAAAAVQPAPVSSGQLSTLRRYAEQAARRITR